MMIEAILNFLLSFSTAYSPICDLREDSSYILAICKVQEKEYAIRYDKKNFGSYYYGEWNGGPFGYGHSAVVVTDASDKHCGYWKMDPAENGIAAANYDAFFDRFWAKFPECPNEICSDGFHMQYQDGNRFTLGHYSNGKITGFGIRDGFIDHPYMGFFSQNEFEGEGIYFDKEKSEFLHGIWKSNRIVKEFGRIGFKDTPKPDCSR